MGYNRMPNGGDGELPWTRSNDPLKKLDYDHKYLYGENVYTLLFTFSCFIQFLYYFSRIKLFGLNKTLLLSLQLLHSIKVWEDVWNKVVQIFLCSLHA